MPALMLDGTTIVISPLTSLMKDQVGASLTSLLIVTGFDRKNLYFEVQTPRNKMQALIDFLHTRRTYRMNGAYTHLNRAGKM
jgi:superfamily II DNA helicase RecQ